MTATSSPSKRIVVLFEISYGDPSNLSIIRFNDIEENLATPFGTFESVPSLKLTLPPYNGVFERQEIQVEFDIRKALLFGQAITNGRAFSECYSRAWQWTRDLTSDALRTLYSGRVSIAIRNPSGKQDILRLNLTTQKAELRRKSGIIGNDECIWTFGDAKTCTVDVGALQETGSVTAIDRNSLTITGLAAHNDFYWNKGRIEADGVRIPIKEWVSGTTFLLSKLTPKEWEDTILGFGSKSVQVFPGCNKKIEVCGGTHDNEENFLGAGISVPAFNPQFEYPG